MAKGQQRSNREAKKPKSVKPKVPRSDPSAPILPKAKVKFGKRGLIGAKG